MLMPRWDDIADMGKADRATGFKCDVCGEDLSREDGHEAIRHGARLFGT
jgi:hypothetical protein